MSLSSSITPYCSTSIAYSHNTNIYPLLYIYLQAGRERCKHFLAEKIQFDIQEKQKGSVREMVAQNFNFQQTAGVLRGSAASSDKNRIYYSELDYPARLDANAWIESDRDFFLNYLPGVRQVMTKLHTTGKY